MTSGNYRIVLLGSVRAQDVSVCEAEIRDRARVLAPNAPLEITTSDEIFNTPAKPSDPSTLVITFTEGPADATDYRLLRAAEWCLANFVPILPVFNPRFAIESQVPENLSQINGFRMRTVEYKDELATTALRLVGLAESDRRVFISYRRSDASKLAEQVRALLIDEGWEVFLDRFSVPSAANFQARLDRELSDKAFVLFIESPGVRDSRWIDHEVAYAIARGTAILSLRLPETTNSQLNPVIDEALRFNLDAGEMLGSSVNRRVKAKALARILREVETRHAAAFSLRRERLMADVSQIFHHCGYQVWARDDRTVIGEKAQTRVLVLTTPRAPEAADLRRLERARHALVKPGKPVRGWIVHPLDDIDEDRALLIKWMCQRRSLSTSPTMLFGERLPA